MPGPAARADVDLEAAERSPGPPTTRATGTHRAAAPVVVDHLRRLASFQPVMFPWHYHERTLWAEFGRIQTAAGINLGCEVEDTSTPTPATCTASTTCGERSPR